MSFPRPKAKVRGCNQARETQFADFFIPNSSFFLVWIRRSFASRRILVERRQNWQGRGQYKEPAAPEPMADVELPEGWVWTRFEQLADGSKHAIKAGPFGSSLKKSFYTPSGFKITGHRQPVATHFTLAPEEMSGDRGAFFVIYRARVPAGSGAVRRLDADTGELKRMYVDPAFSVGQRLRL